MAGPTLSPYVSHPMSRVIIWPTIGLGLLTGCAAATGSANPADSLSALRPQYPSTYVRHPSAPVVIRNATILTAAGPELKNASIVFQDGKITAVGPNVTPPGNATVVDGGGKYVTPGIIDAHSHLGVYAAPGTESQSDGNEATDPTPRRSGPSIASGPRTRRSHWLIAGGITVIQVLPGSANLIGGRSAILRLIPARTVQEMKLPGAPYGLRWPAARIPSRSTQEKGPSTRMGNIAGYRAAFAEAQKYGRKWEAWLAKKGRRPARPRPPAGDPGRRARGARSLVQNHCYRADEMAQMLDLAREFGFHIRSFHHAVEAYKIADLLAAGQRRRLGLGRLVGLQDGVARRHPRERGPDQQAGARAIIHSDSEDGIQRLNQEAAKAMYAGRNAGINITREEAIRWLTANPAWALGIDAPRERSSPAKRPTWSSGRATLSRSTAGPSGCTTTAGWCSTGAIRSGRWIPTSIWVRLLPEWDSEGEGREAGGRRVGEAERRTGGPADGSDGIARRLADDWGLATGSCSTIAITGERSILFPDPRSRMERCCCGTARLRPWAPRSRSLPAPPGSMPRAAGSPPD